jgi:hypothetical protein
MVRVNKKPQYLVFCLHSPHLPSKYRQLPVESSKAPCSTRTRASQLCPRFDATAACPVSPTPYSSLAPAKSARKTQKRCRFQPPLCELWTFGVDLQLFQGSCEVWVPHRGTGVPGCPLGRAGPRVFVFAASVECEDLHDSNRALLGIICWCRTRTINNASGWER